MTSEPPFGSTIVVETIGDSTRYRWSAASRHPLQWIPGFFGGFMLFAAILMPIAIISGMPPEVHFPTPVAFAFTAILLSGGSIFLYAGIKRRGFETLVLSPDAVEYDTGPTVLPLPLMLWFGPMFLYGPRTFGGASMPPAHLVRKRYSLNAELLGPFTLERVGDRQRLRVDNGADRVELGNLLREPEREWLAEQLIRWQQSRKGAS